MWQHPRPTRVLVTGIGLNTGLGASRELSWRRLCAGEHGFRRFESAGSSRPHAGASAYHAGAWLDAAFEALSHGGLNRAAVDPTRAAVVFGQSKGDVRRLASCHAAYVSRAVDREDHLAGAFQAWPHEAATQLSAALRWEGPSLAPVAACATGLVAALQAGDLIRRGVCDVALAGAADASLHPFLLSAFHRLGVLADPDAEPGRAVRPWDVARSGFLVGEGAAALLLEREDHARARGAPAVCELAGGAFGADAYHPTAQNPDPANLAEVIARALRNARVETAEIDHVNVHGTATRSNDPIECQAIRRVFGARSREISCTANKAAIGHCLGAAGAVETALAALAIRDGFVPPTLNLDRPDPLCNLDGTPHVGRVREIRAALKISIGFGGHLAVAVLRRAEVRPP
jgi:3-oxoacyl-[acyl-carrier-protein] synthase II